MCVVQASREYGTITGSPVVPDEATTTYGRRPGLPSQSYSLSRFSDRSVRS